MDNRTIEEIRSNEAKLIEKIKQLEEKIDKAMNLLNYLDEVGLIQDEESFVTLQELKESDE